MPKLSDTMEEGTIVEWKKASGDEVHRGDVLAEVESDKATFDLEADADGTLQILVEKGVPAKIGAPIARIGEGGGEAKTEQKPEPKQPAEQPKKEKPKAESAEPAQAAEPAGREAPEATPEQAERPQQTERAQAVAKPARQTTTKPQPQSDGQGGDVRASPLARRLAEEMGVDLAS